MNATLATGDEKQIAMGIPRDFVDLELELFLLPRPLTLHVDEGQEVFLVADGDGLPVGRPAHIYVLAWKGGHEND